MSKITNPKQIDTNKPCMWLYWENGPNMITRPKYLELCLDTVHYHCSTDFNVIFLNPSSVSNFLPTLRQDLNQLCTIPQKVDYIRLMLLVQYGGIWMDADIIVMKSLLPYYNLLQKGYDYVGFGCYFDDCNITLNGFPQPANWVMISNLNGKLVTLALQRADDILTNNPQLLQQNYHCLGKTLLTSCIRYLLSTDITWKYFHVSSKCVERIPSGEKLTNELLLSDIQIDPFCSEKYIFVPCYNTAPSFPTWFLQISDKSRILTLPTLMSRFFNKSLQTGIRI